MAIAVAAVCEDPTGLRRPLEVPPLRARSRASSALLALGALCVRSLCVRDLRTRLCERPTAPLSPAMLVLGLASAVGATGEPKKHGVAETRRTLAVRTKMLGEAHPGTLEVMRELALALHNSRVTEDRREAFSLDQKLKILYAQSRALKQPPSKPQARQSHNVDKRHAKPAMWSFTGNTGLVRLPQPKQPLGTTERRAKEHPSFKPKDSAKLLNPAPTARIPQPASARRPPRRLFPATASHARAQAPPPRQRPAGGLPPPRQRQQYTRSTVDGTPPPRSPLFVPGMHRDALSPHCSARSLAATAPSRHVGFGIGALPFVNDTAFLAIPKAGSSMLGRHVFTPPNSHTPLSQRRVFTFVREPLQRLLSGYGTLLARLHSVSESLKPAWTAEVDDVRRFQGFVDYLVSTPLEQGFADFNLTQEEFKFRLAHNKKVDKRLWLHVVPQLWLIQRFVEAPIVFVGRLESYRADLDELQRRYGVVLPEVTSARFQAPTNNKDEGRRVVNRSRLVACAPTAIAKLISHLAPDYECLGYEVPSPPRADAPLPADCAVGKAIPRHSSASPISCRQMPGGCGGKAASRARNTSHTAAVST